MKRSAGLFLSSRGNAVVGAVVNITLSTLLTLSVMGLILSAYNTLQIRDAAVEAAARLALPEAPSQQPFLRRLLDDRLPELARYEIRELSGESLVGYQIEASLPLLGFLDFLPSRTEVLVAREVLPTR